MFLFVFCSCGDKSKNSIDDMVKGWIGKKIIFPLSTSLIVYGEKDSVDLLQIKADYRIVSYVDAEGCISCKLQLPHWKRFLEEVDSANLGGRVPFLFYFYPENKSELRLLLERYNFTYPIYIDENDSLNKLNHFPTDVMFQTFLLDGNNKVLVIGSPVLNPKIKDLYLKIIQGKAVNLDYGKNVIQTRINIDRTVGSLGSFDWEKEQKIIFSLMNMGDKHLVLDGVNASCGCTTVQYSKEPVRPGKELAILVTYKAEHPGHFSKTITVYCNAESSPIRLTISGDAK